MYNYPGSLHNHTQYSNIRLRDCIIKENNLIDYAIELGHKAVAITDHDCVSSAIKAQKYYKKVKEKNPDFKLILGNEIYLVRNGLNANNFISGVDKYYHAILIAKDLEGHRQIREISSRAWNRSYMARGMRRVPTYYQDLIDIIQANPGHVIFSTACLGGALPTQLMRWHDTKDDSIYDKVIKWCKQMAWIFGEENFFLELQPSASREQSLVNRYLLNIARDYNYRYIITTDSHYLKKEDASIHKAFLNSQDGDREVDSFYATTYMMSTEELESYLEKDMLEEEIQEGYRNIQSVIDMCEDYDLMKPLKIPQLKWKVPDYVSTLTKDKYFKLIPELYTFYISDYEGDKVLANHILARLDWDETLWNQKTYEAINDCLEKTWVSSEVNKTHWSAYYLNLQKIIDLVWEAGSLVGPGRGSGVGFILLYLLGITQINPLREDTQTYSFRFLNPERVSVLDIDFDSEGSRRQDILNKFKEEYGNDRVAGVATFGTEKSKSAILTACLAPKTLINTLSGLKHIEDVTCEDYVYTTEGIKQVITPTERDYRGTLYNFNCSSLGKEFSVTHNHQLLVYTNRKKESYENIRNYNRCQLIDQNGNVLGEFLSVKEASRYYAKHFNGSCSSMIKYKKHNGFKIIELPRIANHKIQWLCADKIQPSDYLLTPILQREEEKNLFFKLDKDEQNPYRKAVNCIPEKIELTKELAELIGIYLAEGSINTSMHGITFSINQSETWLRDRILYLLNFCFGITEKNVTILNKSESLGLDIQVNSTPLGRWFNKYCKGKSKDKKVPEIIMRAEKTIQKALLYGCFYGDGYARERSNGSFEAKITSISYQLIQDLWQIAANNYYNCSILTTEVNEEKHKATFYDLMFYGKTAKSLYESKYELNLNYDWERKEYLIYENRPYYKIKINDITTEDYEGKVYCLETSCHNYLLNNIVSHNCRGLNIDVDIAQYLSSMIESDRGQLRSLNQTFYGDEEAGFSPNKQFVYEMTENYPEVWSVAQKIEGLVCRLG